MPEHTGTLRGDVVAILQRANRQRLRLATQLVTSLGEFYRGSGPAAQNYGRTSCRSRVSRPAERAPGDVHLP